MPGASLAKFMYRLFARHPLPREAICTTTCKALDLVYLVVPGY